MHPRRMAPIQSLQRIPWLHGLFNMIWTALMWITRLNSFLTLNSSLPSNSHSIPRTLMLSTQVMVKPKAGLLHLPSSCALSFRRGNISSLMLVRCFLFSEIYRSWVANLQLWRPGSPLAYGEEVRILPSIKRSAALLIGLVHGSILLVKNLLMLIYLFHFIVQCSGIVILFPPTDNRKLSTPFYISLAKIQFYNRKLIQFPKQK